MLPEWPAVSYSKNCEQMYCRTMHERVPYTAYISMMDARTEADFEVMKGNLVNTLGVMIADDMNARIMGSSPC